MGRIPPDSGSGSRSKNRRLRDCQRRSLVLRRLGKYELIEEVGRGAMGQVYKAYDRELRRHVAIKTIAGSLVGDSDLLERFYQEARAAGTLDHPNIVKIHALVRDGDTPFIDMEFISGESLETLIQRRPILPLVYKISLILQVARALNYAHKRGIVHRDVKPGNMMLTPDGIVKVVDFGIARLIDASKTQTNMMIGTLQYMSPQQLHGERADQRSDIWALGVVLYELICYERPFKGETQPSLILNIVDEKMLPSPMQVVLPNSCPELPTVIGKMLAKDARQRFQTMEEVLDEVEPLWKSLQQASVPGLVDDVEVLVRAADFPNARDLLRKVLEIDGRNERARLLLDHVNSEERRIRVRVQVESLVANARKFLKRGQLPEAATEAKAALALDSKYGPATEMLAEIERLRQIEEGAQVIKQRLAEGALTEAADWAQKVLILDPENPNVLALSRQIQDQIARRTERKRLASILERARKDWAEQRLDDCIQLLMDAQKEFGADPDVAKLLETAKQDRTEQRKQQKVMEARALLAGGRVSEALDVAEGLSSDHPGDHAVTKLHQLILAEREKLVWRQRLDETLLDVREKLRAGKTKDAVFACEKAGIRFPSQPELEDLLAQARAELKERENRELLQQRISEVTRKINAGQHTDAVDLAWRTLSTVGSDPQMMQLLRAAEMELSQKRKRKEEQDGKLAAAQALLMQGQSDAASEFLQDAIDARVFVENDPRVDQLLNEIRTRTTTGGVTDVEELSRSSKLPPGVELTKDYVYQTRIPIPETSETNDEGFAPTAVGIPGGQQDQRPAPLPSPETALPEELWASGEAVLAETTQAERLGSPAFRALIALLVVAVLGAAAYLIFRAASSRDEVARLNHARQLEMGKQWPAALAEYEALARGQGPRSEEAKAQAVQLRETLALEQSVLAQAHDAEVDDKILEAIKLYNMAADLHGDQEQEALDNMNRLKATQQPIKKPKLAETPSTGNLQPPRELAAPREACELIASDVLRRLKRADYDRANGRYVDAEREYKAVIACQHNNDEQTNAQARQGLQRTKDAMQTTPSN
jgi:serine/threonine protein kinase